LRFSALFSITRNKKNQPRVKVFLSRLESRASSFEPPLIHGRASRRWLEGMLRNPELRIPSFETAHHTMSPHPLPFFASIKKRSLSYTITRVHTAPGPACQDNLIPRLMGEIDHCSSHCGLTKFRGLMIRGKNSAVIGFKQPMD